MDNLRKIEITIQGKALFAFVNPSKEYSFITSAFLNYIDFYRNDIVYLDDPLFINTFQDIIGIFQNFHFNV